MDLARLFDRLPPLIAGRLDPQPVSVAADPGARRALWLEDPAPRAIGLMSSNGSDDVPTVRVNRRRRPSGTAGERPRAEAPTPPSGGGSAPPGGGGYLRPSGGQNPLGRVPGGARGGIGCLGIVLVVGFLLLSQLLGGGGGELPQALPDQGFEEQAPQAEVAPLPTLAPADLSSGSDDSGNTADTGDATSGESAAATGDTAGGDTWTILMYQDADDKILEQDIYVDLNESERIGSTDKVKIVAQVDRFQGGYRGAGDWTSAKRFLVMRDNDLSIVRSQELMDLGEVNMADGRTLVDFVTWGIKNFPADKYALIMSDHGMGWPGGFSDPTASGVTGSTAPLAGRLGDQLYLNEIDAALGEIRRQTGLDKFELVGFDACLMGHLEVYTAMAPHARYAVASQETEPALGWAYTGILSDLNRNPAMTGGELGKVIVETYIDEDQRIADDQARAEMVSGRSSVPSAGQMAEQLGRDITLSAVDLGQIPALNDAVNQLAYAMQQEDAQNIGKARQNAQSFTSIFGQQIAPSYIDLVHFSALVNRVSQDADIQALSNNLVETLQQTVLSAKKGPGRPGAFGVSIYFPVSQLYNNAFAGPQSYVSTAERFAQESLWDDFLAYFYTGRTFEPAAAAAVTPDRAIESPVAGGITATPLEKSAEVAAPGKPVLLRTQVSGENVGYVKLLVGYRDAQSGQIALLDSDYLESADTQEQDGVYYPVWPETGAFNVEFEWDPLVFAISDGENDVVAMLTPETYGESPENALYSVEGTYTYVDGEQRPAKLYLRDGQLQYVLVFSGSDFSSAPREIVPAAGDTFTVHQNWIRVDAQGNVTERTAQPTESVTFGENPIVWTDLYAAAGEYVVGFIIEDLDGNAITVNDTVTVQ